MKISKIMLLAAITICLGLTACKDDETTSLYTPTKEAFDNLVNTALENRTQRFSEDISNGGLYLDTGSGGHIFFNNSLEQNGIPVEGLVDIEFIEMYDKGSMLVTDKPTMATDGDLEVLLRSGGEFFIDVTQNGLPLTLDGLAKIVAPNALTGGFNAGMLQWIGTIDANGNLVWQINGGGTELSYTTNSYYYNYFDLFGWINCDDFIDDPRPRIRASVQVPEGYDDTNSRVFLSANGESYALGRLRFDEEAGLFGGTSVFPRGLECYLIFTTEDEGKWGYAAKEVTLQEDDIISFDWEETATATEEELVDIVNALP